MDVKARRKLFKKQLIQRTWEFLRRGLLHDIEKIEARLHKIKVSGDYSYNQLNSIIGPLKIDENFIPEKRHPYYRTKMMKNVSNFNLNVFINPVDYVPACQIEIKPKSDLSIDTHQSFLIWLDELFPELNSSLVEYAVDLFCEDSSSVQHLFRSLRNTLYTPYQRDAKLIGGNFGKHGKRMNYTYHLGEDKKVYERGDDDKKEDDGWSEDDLGRVRLEYTARREPLKRLNIYTLSDLIRAPKFYEINSRKWYFRRFVKSDKLPKPWEAYTAEDENGNIGSFHKEYLEQKKTRKNISQYTENVAIMSDLREALLEAMIEFDKRWEESLLPNS
jgi:hypothetical protein